MMIVLIIALLVVVMALFYIAVEQGYSISRYERQLMENSKKRKAKK